MQISEEEILTRHEKWLLINANEKLREENKFLKEKLKSGVFNKVAIEKLKELKEVVLLNYIIHGWIPKEVIKTRIEQQINELSEN